MSFYRDGGPDRRFRKWLKQWGLFVFANLSHRHGWADLDDVPSRISAIANSPHLGRVALSINNVDNTSDANKPISTAAAAALSGKADLGGDGKLVVAQLPSIAITEYKGSVANEAAMLNTTGEYGDFVQRVDDGKVWIIAGPDPTQLSSWQPMSYPTGTALGLPGTTSPQEAVPGDDSRLADARTPTGHKASHSTGGSDPLTPAAIGAATVGHTHTAADVGAAAAGHGHTTAQIAGLDNALADQSNRVTALEEIPYHPSQIPVFHLDEGAAIPSDWPTVCFIVRTPVA